MQTQVRKLKIWWKSGNINVLIWTATLRSICVFFHQNYLQEYKSSPRRKTFIWNCCFKFWFLFSLVNNENLNFPQKLRVTSHRNSNKFFDARARNIIILFDVKLSDQKKKKKKNKQSKFTLKPCNSSLAISLKSSANHRNCKSSTRNYKIIKLQIAVCSLHLIACQFPNIGNKLWEVRALSEV